MADTDLTRSGRPRVRVEGRFDDTVAERLLAMVVEDMDDGMARCVMTVGDASPERRGGLAFGPGSALDLGRRLELLVDGKVIFGGRISGLRTRIASDEAPELDVMAEDSLQSARRIRRTRTFVEMSDRDMIEQVARDHGLALQSNLQGPQHPIVVQCNQSDLAFIRERARVAGADLRVREGRLHVHRRPAGDRPRIHMTRGRRLRRIEFRADLSDQFTSLRIAGWSPATRSEWVAEADDAAIRAEAAAGRTGAAVLRSIFGERVETLLLQGYASQAAAEADVRVQFARRARRFVVGEGEAEVNPELRVGAEVEFSRVGARFDGRYLVTGVRHLFDDVQGLRTCFVIERPFVGRETGGTR